MMTEIQILSQSFLKSISPKFKRYFFRDFSNDVRMFFLIGPRGVGKTTSILQHLLELTQNDPLSEKILYVPADHILVEKISLYQIAESFTQNGGKVLAIDEIHKYSNWSKELKSIYDTFKKLKVIISGSSSLEISKGSFDLSRRALVFHMKHMSFREFIELEHEMTLPHFSLENLIKNHPQITQNIVSQIEQHNQKVLPLFRKYLTIGFFPFYKEHASTQNYYLALNQMINSSIENDIISVNPQLSGTSLRRIKKLLAYITESCPFTPDLKKISTALSISDERTIKQYLNYLDKLQIIIAVDKAGGKFTGLQKPEKIYLNNTNFMHALVQAEKIDKGNLRKTFVANLLSGIHDLKIPTAGDFLVDDKYIFEVGGKSKDDKQIKNIKNAYVLSDDIEHGIKDKIPLWLLGFLY